MVMYSLTLSLSLSLSPPLPPPLSPPPPHIHAPLPPGGGGGGVARKSHVGDPSPPAGATSSGATSGGAAPDNKCLVQFMWQPLTQMSYPKVTLLTSFEVYSVRTDAQPRPLINQMAVK